jgi:hypothetical protein
MKPDVLLEEQKTKRLYAKPTLRIIDLVPDQILGVGCKDLDGIIGQPGPDSATACTLGGGPCYEDGS